jgi:tetratricopeptide (TPR) repeat protein
VGPPPTSGTQPAALPRRVLARPSVVAAPVPAVAQGRHGGRHRAGAGQPDSDCGGRDALDAMLGDHQQAVVNCQEALTLQRQLGDRFYEAATLDSLGYAHHNLGQYAEAVGCFSQAMDIARAIGDQGTESCALAHLGDTRQATGDLEGASEAWQGAFDILMRTGGDTEAVRARLHPTRSRR